MAKIAHKYLEIDPWAVIEMDFHPEESRVSESVFSLGNEFMGLRGYFDEGYSGDRLEGSYFNGFYEEAAILQLGNYKGISKRSRFMVNTVDWLYTRITLDGETLDLAQSKFSAFLRTLDLKSGVLSREFIWHCINGKSLKIAFKRFLSMVDSNLGFQRVSFTPLNFSGPVEILTALDFSQLHETQGKNFWSCPRQGQADNVVAILGQTCTSNQKIFSSFQLSFEEAPEIKYADAEKRAGVCFTLSLQQGKTVFFDKKVVNYAEKTAAVPVEEVWTRGMELAGKFTPVSFERALAEHTKYWEKAWQTLDIEIGGDPENQQGIRFCIFQLHQTYHGQNPGNNIGAKGLTGEAYGGHAFWDTETYCLPFYIFSNPKAARNLLMYRYKTLPQALERAKEMDCKGAFYPLATIDGTESCGLWQHASIQLHVGTAIAYGIWHYLNISQDLDFLYREGIEMLIQISRCYASRGQWSPKNGEFGYYGVMGPDEFQLMVNHNCYINFMAKKLFEYTISVILRMKAKVPDLLEKVSQKIQFNPAEIDDWKLMAERMRILYEPDLKLYEEHDGFFDLPHLEIDKIPVIEFPLYNNWSYDRLFRYDMIKQPDVLMFLFLYNRQFTDEVKRANYEYYEPRCIHESSLSPSIHSILASELGKHEEAYNFFQFATRMDLDNYNRNTWEGLHTTSIAAAWMNIVYGFGGMRSDGEILVFKPSIPKQWQTYSFRVLYREAVLCVTIDQKTAGFKIISGPAVTVNVYGKNYNIDSNGIKLEVPVE